MVLEKSHSTCLHKFTGASEHVSVITCVEGSIWRSAAAVFSVLARYTLQQQQQQQFQTPASETPPGRTQTGGSGIALQKLPITYNMQFLPCPRVPDALSSSAIVLIRRPLQPNRVIAREATVEIGRRIFTRGNVSQKANLGERERFPATIPYIFVLFLAKISFV